ncbi:hypothetical protein IGI04_009082 [Brassica rapa subsp. trilocularis]|nr:hypothetical protein IGI04_009082 [Brassica rapa subsp. trilocularis]
MNATIATFMMMMMMMMILTCIASPLHVSESPIQSPTSSPFKCASCDHGMEANPKCVCKNPIKGSMYFPHPNLKDVNNKTEKILMEGLMGYLESSNVHVESVTIRNATTESNLQNLKVDISLFPMEKENFTQRELDIVSFALGTELYKAPATFGRYYFKQDTYIYLQGDGEEGGSDSPDRDALIIKVVSSLCGVLFMFATAGVLYFLRKKMIPVEEPREHNVEKAFNWIEMLDAMSDMI